MNVIDQLIILFHTLFHIPYRAREGERDEAPKSPCEAVIATGACWRALLWASKFVQLRFSGAPTRLPGGSNNISLGV